MRERVTHFTFCCIIIIFLRRGVGEAFNCYVCSPCVLSFSTRIIRLWMQMRKYDFFFHRDYPADSQQYCVLRICNSYFLPRGLRCLSPPSYFNISRHALNFSLDNILFNPASPRNNICIIYNGLLRDFRLFLRWEHQSHSEKAE